MKTYYSASYIVEDKKTKEKIDFRHYGSNFKEYYKNLDELKNDIKIKKEKFKNVVEINIYKIETIEKWEVK